MSINTVRTEAELHKHSSPEAYESVMKSEWKVLTVFGKREHEKSGEKVDALMRHKIWSLPDILILNLAY